MPRHFVFTLIFVAVPLAAQQPPLQPLPPLPPIPAVGSTASTVPRAARAPILTLTPDMIRGTFDRANFASPARFADRALTIASGDGFDGVQLNQFPRQAWVQSDPADSLYRQAREQLNRGDYRKAAALFKDIPSKFPNSAYAADALYWQAFSLYRIGGTAEMQEALSALELQRAKYPSLRSQSDPSALAARIAAGLSTRGLSNDPMVKRALAAGGNSCDKEEQSVQAEALGALMQTDPNAAQQLTRKILARKDDCSASLRKSAVFIIGNRKDTQATATLIAVAKADPSSDVRVDAVSWLARQPGDEALAALEELSRSSVDERVQRSAVRALATHPNAKAHSGIRSLVERNETPEALRIAALDAFDRERTSADDAAWLRATYFKTSNTRVKSRIASIVANLGGEQNEQFLLALIKNEDEPIESRTSALYRSGRTMDIASLAKFYDATSQRQLRESVISLLGERKEPEATDKLIEIVKSGTDPRLRTYAISALTRKKDSRTTKLLLEIIDK